MHLALRRYAAPPRGFAPFFCLGLLAGMLGLAIVDDRIAQSRNAFDAFPSWAVSDVAHASDDMSAR